MLRSHLKQILVICLLLHSISVFSQSTSNRGTDFWIAYAGHIDAKTSRMTLFLTSDINTTYEVRAKNQLISSGTIQANVVTTVFINPNVFDVYVGTSDTKEINKGINVKAANPIAVYSIISNSARTGSTLALPTATLGREYYVFSQQSVPIANGSLSQFTVVGVQDNTTIEINPSQSNTTGTRAAKNPFQITLNKGDIYQYQSQYDLTGTNLKTVNSCSPFAVFSGSTWTLFCEEGNSTSPAGGDNLYQQLFPVTAWGKNFLTAPFYNTIKGSTDMVRIIVSEDNTTVTVNGSTTNAEGTTLNNPYKKGSIISFFTTKPNYIQGSAPIAVAQYQISQTCNKNNPPANPTTTYPGDPEMTILNPVEQTLKDITVYSKLNSVSGVNTNIRYYYLNIIAKTAEVSSFTLDGAPITSSFVPIPNTIYSYAIVDVTNSSAQHRLKSISGFSAIAYGYGEVESYAYLAGTDLKNLSTNVQFYSLDNGTIPQSSFCLGSDFDVVLQLPYVTSKITWDLRDGLKLETETSPSYTTTVIDGQTYYLYKHKVSSDDLKQTGNFNFKAIAVKPITAECSSTDEEIFSSFDVFAPDFTFSASTPQVCVNASVTFTNTSPPIGGKVSSINWDFGDGNNSTLENPNHFYKTEGSKVITMTATFELGCTLSVSKTIEIIRGAKSGFSVNGNLCINNVLQFKDSSVASGGTIVSRLWDFGDLSKSTEVSPTHTYAKSDTYTVSLITTSSGGCSDTLKKELYINALPEITFKDPGSCINDVVEFEGIILKGDIVSWNWDFGDGVIDLNERNKQKPKHKFTGVGIYKVTVTGTSSAGCEQTYSATISINGANPRATFNVVGGNQLCFDKEVSFKNNSSVAFGSITKIEWIFDYKVGGPNIKETDLSPVAEKIYTHSFPVSSKDVKYNVVMIAYSGQTCFAESNPVEVTIYAKPDISFLDVNPVCSNTEAFSLTATVQEGLTGVGKYSGNGVSDSGIFNPRLAGVGSWPIIFTFNSNLGCVSQKTITIVVNPAPSLLMPTNADIIRAGQVELKPEARGDNLKYKWFPSEGLSSDTIANPIAKPNKTTRYTLTVTSLNCALTGEVNVIVHENPNIPNVFSPNGDGKNDVWRIKYLSSFVDASIVIFNRHGQKVFSSARYNTPWDGRFNNQDVPVGVYYYIIEPNNGREKFTGSVTVLR